MVGCPSSWVGMGPLCFHSSFTGISYLNPTTILITYWIQKIKTEENAKIKKNTDLDFN